jgi:hypothetical protein
LVVYIKNIIEVYVEEIITNMEEIIWIGMKDWLANEIKIFVSSLYCPLVNSKLSNANFLRDLQQDINMLRDKYVNTQISIRGDFSCRMGGRAIKLPHLFYFWKDWVVDKDNFSEKRYSKDKR